MDPVLTANITATSTPRGLVLVTVDLGGTSTVTLPMDPMQATQVALAIYRAATSAMGRSTTHDSVFSSMAEDL